VTLVRRVSALADRLDNTKNMRAVGPAAWSVVKLLGVGVASPLLWPGVSLLAAWNTARVRGGLDDHVASVAAAASGATTTTSFPRVGHLDGDRPVVITSDLHRVPAGTHDWPRLQGTDAIYELLLDRYAAESWHLVENGDVEDFWMVGGSNWGWCYDLVRVGASVLPRACRLRVRQALAAEHLDRTVANNSEIYDRIHNGFHLHGRYHRVIGNHDDALADPALVDHLGLHHPGLCVLDALVVSSPSSTPVVIAHGHHTDAWNAPGRAWLGKLGTWFGSTLGDLPFVSAEPGLDGDAGSSKLLDGRQPNVLTVVSRLFGMTRDLYTMDEALLLAAIRARWVPGDDSEPLVVFGHTHLPLSAPTTADRAETWSRYVNAGSGVAAGVVTAVEWQPPTDQAEATLQLVAWCRADLVAPDVAVEHMGTDRLGQQIVRVALHPSPDGSLTPAVAPLSSDAA